MFTQQELAIACDIDIRKINPIASEFDQKVSLANESVYKHMNMPAYRKILNEEKSEYRENKGWSIKKGLKAKHNIPQEAYVLLPKEIRSNSKMLDKWVNKYHPYLRLDSF